MAGLAFAASRCTAPPVRCSTGTPALRLRPKNVRKLSALLAVAAPEPTILADDQGLDTSPDVAASAMWAQPASSDLSSVLSACQQLLHEPKGATRLAALLRAEKGLGAALWSDEPLSAAFTAALAAETNAEAVEAVLELGRPRRNAIIAAINALADKKSFHGVGAMERLAGRRRLLRGPESTELWFSLVRAYGNLGRLKAARRAFKAAGAAGAWTPSHTRQTNAFLNALHADVGLVFVRARQLLEAGAQPDAATFNILLKAAMRAADAERADLALRWMGEAGVARTDVTWSSIIKVRSYCGDFEGVLAARDAMDAAGFEPTPSVWGALLVACGAAQHHETALMLWREAKAALGGPANVPPNLYNAMLTACNSCGQGERSLAILEEMKSAGVRPTVRSYNLAIKACEGRPGARLRLEQVAVALKLYEEMREAPGTAPDEVTYGTLIELCAEGRQGALARRLRERMVEDGVRPNVVIMTSLLKALARAGLVDECLETFGSMVWGPARVRPNRVTFRTLVRALREAGALGAALRAYEGMRKARHAPSNAEFQELIAAAAEAALAEGDPELQAQVASLCGIDGGGADALPPSEVDLHGMSTLEARAAVLCVLSMLMTEYQASGVPPGPLTIITGRGEHSEGGQPVLAPAVMHLLTEELYMMHVDSDAEEECVDAFEGAGCDPDNPGRIVVDSEHLLRWLRARVGTRKSQRSLQRAAAKQQNDY